MPGEPRHLSPLSSARRNGGARYGRTKGQPAGAVSGAATFCCRHPKRECYVECVRCERHICPDYMREATVGFHCPDCVREGAKSVRAARTNFGGQANAGRPIATITLIALNVAPDAGAIGASGAIFSLGDYYDQPQPA